MEKRLIVIDIKGEEQEESTISFKPADLELNNAVFACVHAAAKEIADTTDKKYHINDFELACSMLDGATQYISEAVKSAEANDEMDGDWELV